MMTNLQQCICFCCCKSENPDNIEIVRVVWLQCRNRNYYQLSGSFCCKPIKMTINNSSPKERWLIVYIYVDMRQRGKYPTLAADTEGNSSF